MPGGILQLKYCPAVGDRFESDRVCFQLMILSTQYNRESFSLTGEYPHQGKYWQASVQCDVFYPDEADNKGTRNTLIGLPGYLGFTKDWMASLYGDLMASWRLRTECQPINGTAWVAASGNSDRNLARQHWGLFELQLSYRF